jgi:hypothetical protein
MLIYQIRLHTSLAEYRVGIFVQKPTLTEEEEAWFLLEYPIT